MCDQVRTIARMQPYSLVKTTSLSFLWPIKAGKILLNRSNVCMLGGMTKSSNAVF